MPGILTMQSTTQKYYQFSLQLPGTYCVDTAFYLARQICIIYKDKIWFDSNYSLSILENGHDVTTSDCRLLCNQQQNARGEKSMEFISNYVGVKEMVG